MVIQHQAFKITETDIQVLLGCLMDLTAVPETHPIFDLLIYHQVPQDAQGIYGVLDTIQIIFKDICHRVIGEQDPEQLSIISLRNDFQSTKSILYQSYSYLYHLIFCESVSAYSQIQLANELSTTPRTILRRYDYAITHLAKELTQDESQLRRKMYERDKAIQLPYTASRKLYGQDTVIQDVLEAIEQAIPTLLIGTPRSSKSAILSYIGHQCLGQYDEVHYIPLQTGQSVIEVLQSRFISSLTGNSLILLDNISPRQCVDLLDWKHLNINAVVATTTEIPIKWSGKILDITSLSTANLLALANEYVPYHPQSRLLNLANQSGGLGGYFLDLLHQDISGWQTELSPLQQKYNILWQSLTREQKSIWLWGLVTPLDADSPILNTDKATLLSNRIIVPDSETTYKLTPNAQTLLYWVSSADILTWLYSELDNMTLQYPFKWYMQILRQVIPMHLSNNNLYQVLSRFACHVYGQGQIQVWSDFLEDISVHLSTNQAFQWLTIQRANLYRKQGLLHKSLSLLNSVRAATGEAGNFVNYALATSEIAQIYLYQEQWQRSYEYANNALNIFLRHNAIHYIPATQRCLLQALSQIDLNETRRLFHQISKNVSANESLLRCKLSLSLKEDALAYQQWIQFEEATHYLKDTLLYARSLTVRAEIAYRQNSLHDAIKYQKQAIALLRTYQDAIGVARASNNLGGYYYRSEHYSLAHKTWETAYELSLTIEDPISLNAIQANLVLLGNYGQPTML